MDKNLKIEKYKPSWSYFVLIIFALLIIGGFLYFLTLKNLFNFANFSYEKNKISADDDPFLGEQNASVKIIEFSDYQCPFCRKFWGETLPLIKKKYIDTGKVKFVYRDFPSEKIHPAAFIAAEAANCVREKGGDSAYWKMHDKIFEEQNKLDSGKTNGQVTKTVQFSKNDLENWAKEIGYEISSCLDSKKYKTEIEKDLKDGLAKGVKGTPTFFINGKILKGAQPYEIFEKAIEAEL